MNKMSPGNISQEAGKVSLEDPEVIEAVNGFLADMEQGKPADRQQLVRRFPDIANELAACLDGLDLLHRVAPQLQEPSEDASDSSQPIQAAATLGDFRIVREIGRGGMFQANHVRKHMAQDIFPVCLYSFLS